MSKAAFTIKTFGVYLVFLGVCLAVSPNTLLSLFGVPETSEVWIRVAGVVVINEGICYWFAASSNAVAFFRASVYARVLTPFAFGIFVATGLAPSTLVGFGLVDLAAAAWTYIALRREHARSAIAG